MRQMIEVTIPRKKHEVIFQHKCSDPDVVCGDGRTLLAQLVKKLSVVANGTLGRKEAGDTGSIQKPRQNLLVLSSSCTAQESGPEFRNRDKRQGDVVRRLKAIERHRVVVAKVAITIRVDGEVHFQSSGSI